MDVQKEATVSRHQFLMDEFSKISILMVLCLIFNSPCLLGLLNDLEIFV